MSEIEIGFATCILVGLLVLTSPVWFPLYAVGWIVIKLFHPEGVST